MPFLFLISFAGTKLVGIEPTVRLFRAMGRFPRLSRRASLEEIRRRVRRGFALLPLPIQCLDQAIVTWYLLSREGYAASLKIGVTLAPLYSHAWVQSGSHLFGDVPRLDDFHVVAEYQGFAS